MGLIKDVILGGNFSLVGEKYMNKRDIRGEAIYKRIMKKINNGEGVSPLMAIRAHCLQCCGFQEKEVMACLDNGCPLNKFRFGKNRTGKKETL